MLKKYFISRSKNFYKANIHCHSTVSDGKKTPEEIKRDYMARGYSVVAFTDHEVLADHKQLADSNFLPLHGCEVGVMDQKTRKACHLGFIAKDSNIKSWRSSDFLMKREYTPECINAMIKEAKANNFFVIYNHPTWSRESFMDYCQYKGMDAMEIINHGAINEGSSECNERVYEDMLLCGNRIYCVAGDDNHNKHPETSRGFDSFGAYIVINAQTLEYKEVIDALENGNFYTSTGASIEELYIDNGRVFVTSKDAVRINYITPYRQAKFVFAEKDESLGCVCFEIDELDDWFRLKIFDKNGKCALTNAYFLR